MPSDQQFHGCSLSPQRDWNSLSSLLWSCHPSLLTMAESTDNPILTLEWSSEARGIGISPVPVQTLVMCLMTQWKRWSKVSALHYPFTHYISGSNRWLTMSDWNCRLISWEGCSFVPHQHWNCPLLGKSAGVWAPKTSCSSCPSSFNPFVFHLWEILWLSFYNPRDGGSF